MSKAPQLKVVRELNRDDVIHHLNNGYKSLSDLERRSGISRKILEGLQEEYDKKREKRLRMPSRKGLNLIQPPAGTAPEATAGDPKPIRPPRSPSIIGAGLIILGIIAGIVGGFINWRYSYSLGGQDQLISLACGMIGIVVDGAQQLFLPAVVPLWKKCRYVLAVVAFLVWWPFLAGSTYAALGFVGVSLGDVMQARKAPATQRELLTAQLERTVKLRNAIMELGDQRMLENRMNAALGAIPRRNRELSDDCKTPTPNFSAAVCAEYVWLKGAWTAAKSRDEDDAVIASLTAQINALPAIGPANPAAEQLSQITDGRINTEQASNYQIRWLAVVPGSSSILLTLGLALL